MAIGALAMMGASGDVSAEPAAMAVAANEPPANIGSEPDLNFDIAPQPLATALQAYVEQAHVEMGFDHQLIANKHSPGIEGKYTAADALNALLSGSGLTAHYENRRSIVLLYSPVGAMASVLPSGQAMETLPLDTLHVAPPSNTAFFFGDMYAHFVQDRLGRMLKSYAQNLRPGYSLQINVWIGETGTVERSAVSWSSGNRLVDNAILQVVNGAPVGQAPPLGFMQPVHLHIATRKN
jgi:hypothetical protein